MTRRWRRNGGYASRARWRSSVDVDAAWGLAGLRVERLDAEVCVVRMPGGWRTRNPFRSTYWAAQGMAGEMSTGVMGFLMTQAACRR